MKLIIQRRLFRLGLALLVCICEGRGQRTCFEVVSIKANKSGQSNGSMGPRGSRFLARNVTLSALLMYAYRPPNGQLFDAQMIDVPDWAKTEHFDIDAKPEGDGPVVPGEQTRAMVRCFMEDRFQLRVHWETRNLPVYNLILTKKGPKLSEDQTQPDESQALISVVSQGAELGPLKRGALRMITSPTNTTLVGTAVPISTVIELLQGQSDRIMFDKTGFDKLIDVHIAFSRDLDATAPGIGVAGAVESGTEPNQAEPHLFTALQDAGLKLEREIAPLRVLVIETVRRPSEN